MTAENNNGTGTMPARGGKAVVERFEDMDCNELSAHYVELKSRVKEQARQDRQDRQVSIKAQSLEELFEEMTQYELTKSANVDGLENCVTAQEPLLDEQDAASNDDLGEWIELQQAVSEEFDKEFPNARNEVMRRIRDFEERRSVYEQQMESYGIVDRVTPSLKDFDDRVLADADHNSALFIPLVKAIGAFKRFARRFSGFIDHGIDAPSRVPQDVQQCRAALGNLEDAIVAALGELEAAPSGELVSEGPDHDESKQVTHWFSDTDVGGIGQAIETFAKEFKTYSLVDRSLGLAQVIRLLRCCDVLWQTATRTQRECLSGPVGKLVELSESFERHRVVGDLLSRLRRYLLTCSTDSGNGASVESAEASDPACVDIVLQTSAQGNAVEHRGVG